MKKSIAELRKMEALKLAELGDGNIDKAVSLMNSFYRFCGLDKRCFYAENDERCYNTAYTKRMIERRDKWLEKLSRRFAEYGLKLVYCGYLPSIGIVYPESGGFSEKINRWFYD